MCSTDFALTILQITLTGAVDHSCRQESVCLKCRYTYIHTQSLSFQICSNNWFKTIQFKDDVIAFSDRHLFRIHITGNPGIGKSYFGMYSSAESCKERYNSTL